MSVPEIWVKIEGMCLASAFICFAENGLFLEDWEGQIQKHRIWATLWTEHRSRIGVN